MPSIWVSDAVLTPFRAAVFNKHGRLYGALRDETEAALLFHIDRNLPKHPKVPTDTPKSEKNGAVRRRPAKSKN